MLNVIFECNGKYFEAVYLTILSISRRTKEPCSFYILSADLTDIDPRFTTFTNEQMQHLESMVRDHNPQSTIKLIDCAPQYRKYFSNLKIRTYWKKRWPPYILFKLFTPYLPELKGKALYVDCDILANGDIKEIFDIDMQDNEVLAARDFCIRFRKFKRYHNVGVLLMDLDKLRNSGSFLKAIELINRKRPMLIEQDAINWSCKIKRFGKNDFKYNWQKDGIGSDTVFKHFWCFKRLKPSHTNIKPWDIDKVQNILKLHNWDEDYKYFIEQKKKWSNI